MYSVNKLEIENKALVAWKSFTIQDVLSPVAQLHVWAFHTLQMSFNGMVLVRARGQKYMFLVPTPDRNRGQSFVKALTERKLRLSCYLGRRAMVQREGFTIVYRIKAANVGLGISKTPTSGLVKKRNLCLNLCQFI